MPDSCMPACPSPAGNHNHTQTSPDPERNADTDPVMADQSSHNVVNNDRLMGEQSSIDVHANNDQITYAASGNNLNPAFAQILTIDAQDTNTLGPKTRSATGLDSLIPAASFQDADAVSQPSRNGTPAPTVNGERHGTPSGDELNITENVGSDTDSRADSGDQGKMSSSLKKPASFKTVSVTKAFLAKAATTAAPAASKVGDKSMDEHCSTLTLLQRLTTLSGPATVSLQPMAKPRLVAKSGSGLRDIPRVRPGEGASAPDGRTVWNKNQREDPAVTLHSLALTRLQLFPLPLPNSSPTKSLSSNTVSISLVACKRMSRTENQSGQMSTMTRKIGHPKLSSGWMAPNRQLTRRENSRLHQSQRRLLLNRRSRSCRNPSRPSLQPRRSQACLRLLRLSSDQEPLSSKPN